MLAFSCDHLLCKNIKLLQLRHKITFFFRWLRHILFLLFHFFATCVVVFVKVFEVEKRLGNISYWNRNTTSLRRDIFLIVIVAFRVDAGTKCCSCSSQIFDIDSNYGNCEREVAKWNKCVNKNESIRKKAFSWP